MKIYMDTNEYIGHPAIVEGILKVLNYRLEKSDDHEMFTNNEVISKHLDVGDYQFNKIIVEHKALANYGGDVLSGHIFQQAQDILHCMSLDAEVHGYILISGNITDIINLSYESKDKKANYPFRLAPMLAAAASLNRIGVPTIFIGNQDCFINFMVDLFTKYYDGKNREYNPARKPVRLEDEVQTNYCGIPEISEGRAKLLQKRFPIPKNLYNATKEELMEVDKIGEITADTMLDFFNGIKPKEVAKIGDQVIWETTCRKCKKSFRSVDNEQRYCNVCKPSNLNKISKV